MFLEHVEQGNSVQLNEIGAASIQVLSQLLRRARQLTPISAKAEPQLQHHSCTKQQPEKEQRQSEAMSYSAAPLPVQVPGYPDVAAAGGTPTGPACAQALPSLVKPPPPPSPAAAAPAP
eukprot:CAMPEP_0202863956 /NCGR_PEP_ID=MMETSP1391-20130828/4387_1 /ASSEMBLY_ACC=CAM_ASM_000867 /TAXON_ID=1034604 /ORGANISM="Chlamydomonas leiostraca, Strain SAG 11-49" /LENGTH=118 /DNA_ID=CAMNT_0049543647 /DNA_START=12 /DNA_END=365 /DNA_ORIENTATION=-